MIGQIIGNYKILEKISKGEMIEFYKGVDLLLNRNVVIKVLGQAGLNQSVIQKSFWFEAATLAKLNHPCIPTLHSLMSLESELVMISEFTDGETLYQTLRRREKLLCREAVSIFAQVLDCLDYSHKAGIVHGNLKTSDIVLTDAGTTVKILGFGTSEYISPNQTEECKVAVSSDIYALGVMLFEVLTGEASFNAENNFELKDKSVKEISRRLRSGKPSIPENVESAIIKAVFPNPIEKFQTASEFRNALTDASNIGIFVASRQKTAAGQLLTENSIKPIPEKKPRDSVVSSYYLNFFPNKNKIAEGEFNQKRRSADESSVAQPDNSFAGKSGKKRYKLAAAIFAVFVLQFVWQFSFIQSENLRRVENSLKNIQLEDLPVEIKTDDKPVEVKTDYAEKKSEIKNPAKNILPIAFPQPENKPVREIIKPKTSRETKTERLRRAEKLLTGF